MIHKYLLMRNLKNEKNTKIVSSFNIEVENKFSRNDNKLVTNNAFSGK